MSVMIVAKLKKNEMTPHHPVASVFNRYERPKCCPQSRHRGDGARIARRNTIRPTLCEKPVASAGVAAQTAQVPGGATNGSAPGAGTDAIEPEGSPCAD